MANQGTITLKSVKRLDKTISKGQEKLIAETLIWTKSKSKMSVYLVNAQNQHKSDLVYAYIVNENNYCQINNILKINVPEDKDFQDLKLIDKVDLGDTDAPF